MLHKLIKLLLPEPEDKPIPCISSALNFKTTCQLLTALLECIDSLQRSFEVLVVGLCSHKNAGKTARIIIPCILPKL